MLTSNEKETIEQLLCLIESILSSIESEFNKNIDDYSDLLKAKNILASNNTEAMKSVRKKLRNGFRMIDESIQVPDALNGKINDAYEIAMVNEIFNNEWNIQ